MNLEVIEYRVQWPALFNVMYYGQLVIADEVGLPFCHVFVAHTTKHATKPIPENL